MRDVSRVSAQICLVVLAILCAVLSVFFLMLVIRSPSPPLRMADLHAAWQNRVSVSVAPILAAQSPVPEDVRRARESLLAMIVAPEDRDTHLALVVALLGLERNEQGAIEKLREAFIVAQR